MKNTYFSLKDYREIKTIVITETLTEEDLKEGLFPEEYCVKLAFTNHALDRMFNTRDRGVEFEEVETALISAGEELLSLRRGDEFVIITQDQEFSVVGNVEYFEGNLVLIIHTVIKVEKKGNKYKKIRIKESESTKLIVSLL